MGTKRWKKREGGKTTTIMNILKVNMALTQCFTGNFEKTLPSKVHAVHIIIFLIKFGISFVRYEEVIQSFVNF